MWAWKRCAAVTLSAAVICLAVTLLLFPDAFVRGDEEAGNDAPARQYDVEEGRTDTIRLQGSSRQASQKFSLEPGVAIFEVSHDGDSNFVVRLLDENGQSVDTLFNQIGAYHGDQGFAIAKAGQYLLDVAADGNWTVAIRQPRLEQGQPAPASLQGTGSHASKFLQLAGGLNIFKMKHNGKTRFRVTLRDEGGRPVETLINTLGAFDGSKPISIEKPGVYFLNVGADGDWSIELE